MGNPDKLGRGSGDETGATFDLPKGSGRSEDLHREATEVFPGGVSHNIRYFEPHPIYVEGVEGGRIRDADGNEYVDFWMNHVTSVLGHAHLASWRRCANRPTGGSTTARRTSGRSNSAGESRSRFRRRSGSGSAPPVRRRRCTPSVSPAHTPTVRTS